MTTRPRNPITIPTIVFDSQEGCSLSFPHNDLMVIKLKMANTLVDIITLDYPRKLKYPRGDITPPVHQILTLGGDFLVVYVPITYNIILGRPTLHTTKAVIAPYLIQIQYEGDNGSVGKLFRDQWTTQECYLHKAVGGAPSCTGTCGAATPSKKLRTTSPVVAEALTIYAIALADPEHHAQRLLMTYKLCFLNRGVQIGRSGLEEMSGTDLE
ncbi:LOW QUALITY PROTEIN: hypothetical protein Cgig2_009022 [Carnegiea gigantea]|uniref:Uncharacterized protein n=1 Tax=Carnegiea gigantea TaxID=171969 RepID=A0A9Q1KCU0_9CARY|nr:LOW QUALITY PROTEIN: hypothetical protein Cgig2_009022 [Carnegiea gigantea]